MLLHSKAPWACGCSSVVERTSTGSGFWTFSTCGQLDGSALASLSQRTHKTPVELCHVKNPQHNLLHQNEQFSFFLCKTRDSKRYKSLGSLFEVSFLYSCTFQRCIPTHKADLHARFCVVKPGGQSSFFLSNTSLSSWR